MQPSEGVSPLRLRHFIGGAWVDAPSVGIDRSPFDPNDIVATTPDADLRGDGRGSALSQTGR
ncbi:MAG: hypothetical protein ACRDHO_09445, partial [Actinomycetota bacterium]